MINCQRLQVSNQVLALMAKGIAFSVSNNKIYIEWDSYSAGKRKRKLYTPNNRASFYSSHRLPTGGTVDTAINQLWRWIKNKPCLPLGAWRMWTNPEGGFKIGAPEIVDILSAAGYPETGKCCICGADLKEKGFTWYYSQKPRVEGAGCWGHSVLEINKKP